MELIKAVQDDGDHQGLVFGSDWVEQVRVEVGADLLGVTFDQPLGHRRDAIQEMGVPGQVGHAELDQAGLARSQNLTGAAEFEVFLGDAEAVRGLAHDVEPLSGHFADGRAVQQHAG